MSNVMEEHPIIRFLAAYEVNVDYSILAVMVCTLGLILVVELIRHHLDHKAESRPFFQAVLTSVYSELSTLGVVEAAIYVLHSYYAGLDVPKETVFAYCHFMLFFTAIFNALQSCIEAFFSYRVAQRLWVRTEELELHHYVAIREEFDLLEQQVQLLKTESHGRNPVFDGMCYRIRRFFRVLSNPYKFQKYRGLLHQVRFHELRVHFLQANDLPLKLKVSDYLKRSKLAVLQRLVSISAFAWILLTSAVNISYYVLGMVVYASNDGNKSTAKAMAYMYIGANVLFVSLSILIYFKMKNIFNSIMEMKFIDCGVTSDRIDHDQYEEMRKKQLALFWGGEPSYIVGLIQFMQFGYAICAAILIIFWAKIDKDGYLPASDYLITLAVCYSLFVLVLAQVLPRYTMCTSLGALVDRKRLKEMITKCKLEEAVDASYANNGIQESAGRTVVSESDGSSVAKLSMVAELVQTKTEDLRSSRSLNLVVEQDASDSIRQRRLRRKKSYSDSRSIAMMKVYGRQSESTIPEADDFCPDENFVARSSNYLDLSGAIIASVEQPELMPIVLVEGNPEQPMQEEPADHMPEDEQHFPLKRSNSTEGESSQVQPDPADQVIPSPQKSPADMLIAYAGSAIYRMTSELFGTMVCFFLVGMRVEVLLLARNEIEDLETTFHLSVGASFWLEMMWLTMMIISSLVIIGVSGHHHLKLRLAACADVAIGASCLVLLVCSEIERCCKNSSGADDDCCGAFGSRTYGGLGNIEPFTCLVVLRLFRHFAARKFLEFLRRRKPNSDTELEATKGEDPTVKSTHKAKNMADTRGTIVDLWQQAVGLYPDVVEKEGEFSGALLKAMLGINVDGIGRKSITGAGPPQSITGAGPPQYYAEPPGAGKSNDQSMDGMSSFDDATIKDLVSPECKLIFPMRRCDWMLPPLIDHWRSVDVVMTEKEIVILESVDLDDTGASRAELNQLNSLRGRIVATNGGKGMRLREVLVGRKVLGHVDMVSIDSLHVERFPPMFGDEPTDSPHDHDFLKDEYWSPVIPPADSRSRTARWKGVSEDQLKIHSIDSSTYLRFYCDLEAKEQESGLPPMKVAAFQWCKSIGRVRGSHNLIQKLPHFLQGDVMEFLDYLHITQRGHGEENHRHITLLDRLHIPHGQDNHVRRSWMKKVPTLLLHSSKAEENHDSNV